MTSIYIGLPTLSSKWKHILFAFFLSIVIVFSVVKQFKSTTFLIILIFAFLIYILMNSSTSDNLAGSVPSVTYPIPPHLGLDGVDLVNQS